MIRVDMPTSLVITSDPNYSSSFNCIAVKNYDVYHDTKAQTCIKDMSILYEYGTPSSPHYKLLLDENDAISIYASSNRVSSK